MNKDFGNRLKRERERLGLSQADFAKACGVGKTAQYTYEKGDREPSLSYMEKAEELGADGYYLFTGVKLGEEWANARAYMRMISTIEMLLGLEEKRLENIALMLIEEEKKGDKNYDPYNREMMEWLKTSTKPDRCLDIELLARVLTSIETHIKNNVITLTPEKKIKAAITIYRSFKASGNLDEKIISEVIELARP